MKRWTLSLCFLYMAVGSYAQWQNTTGGIYYDAGNAGLGHSDPRARLHLEGEGSFRTNAWFGKAFINNSQYHFNHARIGISGTSDVGQYGAGIHFQVRNMSNTNYFHAIVGQSREGNIIFETGGAGVVPPTEKMTILSSGNVGVGIIDPRAQLHLEGEGDHKSSAWFGKSFINDTRYHFERARVGISGSSNSGQYGAGIHFQVRNMTNTNYLHAIVGQSREGNIIFETGGVGATSPTAKMIISNSGQVGIGTSSPGAKLAVKGDIHAEEVRVDLTVPGPDYVFEEDYDLPTLESLQNYIRENKHLPEVPSAKEMEANGIDLGVMNMLLLKKVEEMTLYQIELFEILKEQQKEIESLKSKTEDL